MLKGKPALVDSTSPQYGEKASYYSAVCLETGEMEWMELEGNSNSGTSIVSLDSSGGLVHLRLVTAFRPVGSGLGLGWPCGSQLSWRVVSSASSSRTRSSAAMRA